MDDDFTLSDDYVLSDMVQHADIEADASQIIGFTGTIFHPNFNESYQNGFHADIISARKNTATGTLTTALVGVASTTVTVTSTIDQLFDTTRNLIVGKKVCIFFSCSNVLICVSYLLPWEVMTWF